MQSADRLDFRSYRSETERHAHGFWQVVLPVRGRLDMEIDGEAGSVGEGAGALIPAGLAHAFEAEGENRFLVADVESLPLPARLAERFADKPFFTLPSAVHALVDFSRATGARGPLAGPWSTLLLAALDQQTAQKGQERTVARAVAYMQDRLAEPLTLADLARIAGLAEHRLHQAFHAVCGTSPYAYLNRLRLEKALRLIEETGLPLSEIAMLTGHADQSALSRRMRRFGYSSPAAHRRFARQEMAGFVRNDQDRAGQD